MDPKNELITIYITYLMLVNSMVFDQNRDKEKTMQ